MKIRPAKGFHENMPYRPDWLLKNCKDVVFIYINNTYVAIINCKEDINKVHSIRVRLNEPVPMYKQALEIQRGRVPNGVETVERVLSFRVVTENTVYRCMYRVYEQY